MRFKPSFAIYSLDRPNKPYYGSIPMNCKGVYKGVSERSRAVPLTDLDIARMNASQYNQESILIVENGSCWLEYLDTGKQEYLGEWAEIDRPTATKLEAYTEYNGKFFATI